MAGRDIQGCGTRAAYKRGCRCDDCVRANADYYAVRAYGRTRDALSIAIDHAPPPPGPWVERGACRGMDPNLFHPERGESTRQAKAACAVCPVAGECLGYALDNHLKCGVWGGTSERERRTMRRDRKVVAA